MSILYTVIIWIVGFLVFITTINAIGLVRLQLIEINNKLKKIYRKLK